MPGPDNVTTTETTGPKVCDPNDPWIQGMAGRNTETIGWSEHGRDVDNLYPGSFDPCRQMQWIYGGYVGPDGQDLGFQHGWYAVQQLKSVEEGLNGQFETENNKLVCIRCHPKLPSDIVFIPKLEEPPSPADEVDAPMLQSRPPPECNTCHPIHTLFWDFSSLQMTDISMTPDGKKMVPSPDNPTEKSPCPPMVNSLGCPQCHESPREDSLARQVTDVTRHEKQPCMTCHPAPTPAPADTP